MSKTIVLGLTGPTGAGKSTVCAAMLDSGCVVIDTDLVAREVVSPGSPCLEELKKAFGEEIFRPDGTLFRQKLAQRAFASPEATQKLNSITHPYILQLIEERIKAHSKRGAEVIVLDAPLLFEGGADKLCDFVAAVIAPMELRTERIMQRDGISRETAERRIRAQHREEYYTQRVHFVLNGDERLDDLYHDARELIQKLREERNV